MLTEALQLFLATRPSWLTVGTRSPGVSTGWGRGYASSFFGPVCIEPRTRGSFQP